MTVGLNNTTLLNLPLPVEGYFDGTWGNLVNFALTDYLDIAIAGTLTFTGDGAITLANTAGDDAATNITSTSAQYAVIKIAGTLTTTKIITAPSLSKIYVVDNAATGGAVTFKASGQTGVSVVVGEKCVVYYNGTDYVKVASSVVDGVSTISFGSTGLTPATATSGAVTVAGTLAVANGGTGVTTSTGTGNVVLSTSPTLVTPALGTPSSATLTNATGLPISTGVSGLGTGVATFLATPSSANLAAAVSDETGTGSLVFANSPTLATPALGTPSSVTLTNATGLPISTGVSGLGTGVATFLATPSSANLRSALTDETGTGSAVFATSPTLVTPILGTPTSATLTNATGLPISTGVSGLGTGVATALAVNVGSAGAPVVNGGVLGTPSSGTATNLTGLPLTTGVTGTLPVANGGTGVTTSTGTGSVVLSASPALTGTPTVPTAVNGTNTTQAASTAFVINQIGAISSGVTTFSAGTTGLTPTLATNGAVTLAGTLAIANGGTGTTSTTFVNAATNVTGTLAVANGGTGVTTSTGSGNNVLSTSPTLVTPILGTPTSATLTNATGLPLTTGVTGLLPVANGGTGTATPSLVGGSNVTVTGTWPNQTIASTASTAGQYQAVASGTLANGSTIIVNVDGTVSAVAADSQSGGSATAFSGGSNITNSTDSISIGYDSTNNRVVVAYVTETGTRGRAAVGTVSGTSISFGTPVEFESTGVSSPSVAFDPNTGKVVIAYNVGSTGKAIVGTVSGTSISYGTAVTFDASTVAYVRAVYDASSTKVVIAYQNTITNYGWAIVGTVSGTSISFGTAVNFNAANSFYVSAAATGTKVVVSYRNGGNSNYGTAIVGTVSGTSISFGTAAVFQSAVTNYIMSTYDSTNAKVVIGYVNNGNSDYGTAVVGTVSGTSISFGTPVVFNAATTFSSIAISYSLFANRVVIACWNSGSGNNGAMLTGTVSGTSISFSASATYNSVTTFRPVLTYSSTEQKLVVAYQFNAANGVGNAQVLTVGFANLTATNYIGISNASYANGATATIQIVGSVDDAQSGLTPGLAYYVQNDGTLSTTAGSPSVFAGTAVSATQILVKG